MATAQDIAKATDLAIEWIESNPIRYHAMMTICEGSSSMDTARSATYKRFFLSQGIFSFLRENNSGANLINMEALLNHFMAQVTDKKDN